MPQVYNNIAYLHFLTGDYSISLNYYNEAIDINLKIDNKIHLAGNYLNKGILLSCAKRYPESLSILMQALSLYKEQNNPIKCADVNLQIGQCYVRSNVANAAYSYFDSANAIYEQYNVQEGIALCHEGKANYYFLKNEYHQARDELKEALSYFIISRQIHRQGVTYASLASLCYFLGEKDTYDYFCQAIKIFLSIRDKAHLIEVLNFIKPKLNEDNELKDAIYPYYESIIQLINQQDKEILC